MKIKVFGGDDVGWSTDFDRENVAKILNQKNEWKTVKSFFLSRVFVSVSYDQLLLKSNKWLVLYIKLLKKVFKSKLVAVITNDVRGDKEKITKLKDLVDGWISPNSKISQFLKEKNLPYSEVPFYVDSEKFFPLKKSKKELADFLGIKYSSIENKFLIGSFQRDSLGEDLSKPKWQKNPGLLVKIAREIKDQNILFVLAGPRRHYVIRQFEKEAIPYIYLGDRSYIDDAKDDISVNNLSQEKMNYLYNVIDLYLVSSSSEGGPKAVIESALCKKTIFSTDVGLAKDFLHEQCIYSEDKIEELKEKIVNMINKTASFDLQVEHNHQEARKRVEPEKITEGYEKIFKQLSVL